MAQTAHRPNAMQDPRPRETEELLQAVPHREQWRAAEVASFHSQRTSVSVVQEGERGAG